jgi:hypothetical protein
VFPANFPAANTGRSLELLDSRGSCKVTELDDLAPFLVDEAEAEAMGLQTIPSEKEEGGTATSNGQGEHYCGILAVLLRWAACAESTLLFWVSSGVWGCS